MATGQSENKLSSLRPVMAAFLHSLFRRPIEFINANNVISRSLSYSFSISHSCKHNLLPRNNFGIDNIRIIFWQAGL